MLLGDSEWQKKLESLDVEKRDVVVGRSQPCRQFDFAEYSTNLLVTFKKKFRDMLAMPTEASFFVWEC